MARGNASITRGLTLIELMVALAIAAILAALALPSFRQHVLKARRAEAIAALTAVQQAQERFRTHRPAYAGSLAELRQATHSAQGRYAIRVIDAGPSSYTVIATPLGGQADDRQCGAISVRLERGNVTNQAIDASGADSSRQCWSK